MNWLKIKYQLLTFSIFLPLLWAFVYVRNVYPVATWNVMMAPGLLEHGRSYWILRGETVSGETIDIPAISLTNALYARTWTMVNATVDNQAFKISHLHPANAELLRQAGGLDHLPPAARVPDLLRAWGDLYNERLAPSSPQRLKAIRLDMYRWEGGSYANYDNFIQTWRQEL
ncbi:MAG TPA: hypothetical protein VJ749_03985 [Pyrinomonadaceae bacterium]|jgi:hypothetical protein|nr:hypothetical protein [Pyrinomonadaceae bacterium]